MDDLAIIDRFTETFSRYIDSGFGLLAGDIAFLTSILIAIDITLAGLFWALMGEDDVPAQLIRKILYIGFFALLLSSSKGLADVVFQSFTGLGLKASGASLTAADLMRPGFVASTGFSASRPLIEKAGELIGMTTFFSTLRDHRRAAAGVADRAARVLRPQRPALHRHHRIQAHGARGLCARAVCPVRPHRPSGRARARQRHLLRHQPDGAGDRGRHRLVAFWHSALLLVVIALVVLLALAPPGIRLAGPQELVNVEYKPITDALSKLPATYDGVKPEKNGDAAAKEAPVKQPGVPLLVTPAPDLLADAEPAEKARLARLAGEAIESGVFFRLQLKPPSKGETAKKEVTADPAAKEAPVAPDGGLAALTALRAANRALALAGGDTDLIGATLSTADHMRKLTFFKAGPEKEVYNPHGLQTPVSAYQLMAGTVIAASLVGLNSDLPGFVIAQVTEHVYDTVTGGYFLVPQGSRLVGKYDNIVAFGQERALVVWQRIIHRDQQPAGYGHWRLRRPRRSGGPPHLEAPEGGGARDRPRSRQEVAGRANAALGVVNMGTAFGLQSLAGLSIAQWPGDGGHYPAVAHQASMAAGLALQRFR
jgi:Bacterial conjugation TrbI-like protein/TrbL/VirB6 plasmid conjugal transfer protein